jgi:hypothetical protein
MPSGRKPGYKHSKETRDKIRRAHTGQARDTETRKKISKSLSGKEKSESHRDAIANSRYDLDRKCIQRFLELRNEYPGYEDFFDRNRGELLYAMQDIKSEKELREIRRYIENTRLDDVPQVCLTYQYDSSSIFAQEDAMLELIDISRFLKKKFSTLSLVDGHITS